MTNPKWLDELDRQVAGMPFGEIDVKVIRHRSKTAKVTYNKDSTLAPKSNEEAFSDLQTLLKSLQGAVFTGKVRFELDFRGGTIKLITIKNQETKTYGENQR